MLLRRLRSNLALENDLARIGKGLARSAAFLERLVDCLRRVGIDVYQIDHEDANGQFEVNFTYADALSTADRHIFLKMATSEIANQMGMIATFMPKPFSNRTGTGGHFLSVGDEKNSHPTTRMNGWGFVEGYQFLAGCWRTRRLRSARGESRAAVVGQRSRCDGHRPHHPRQQSHFGGACLRPSGDAPPTAPAPYLPGGILAAGMDGSEVWTRVPNKPICTSGAAPI
jgi:hypothetical protein